MPRSYLPPASLAATFAKTSSTRESSFMRAILAQSRAATSAGLLLAPMRRIDREATCRSRAQVIESSFSVSCLPST